MSYISQLVEKKVSMVRKGIEELKKNYVEDSLEWFHEHNLGKDWGVESMKELFRLSKIKGPDVFVTIGELQQAGIPYGIARWVPTGVVEKAEGRRAYRIRKVFYEPTKQALLLYAHKHP